MDEIIEKIYSKMTKNDLLLITGDHGMVDHPMLKHMSPSGVATGAGLPSHKVRNGVQKVPDGVHVRYKIFRNGVHLWGTEVFFKIKGGAVKHH
jgi:hypothetical protein